VKGTWRKGSLPENAKGYLQKAVGVGISFQKGGMWGTWRRALTRDLESWMKGLWGWGISLSRGSVKGA
jgi:hypothetical protein